MKAKLISGLFAITALVVLSACGSAEERAARAAEQAAKVKAGLAEKRFSINVDRMYPMKGGSKNVSFGYGVEVRNDSLISYLPYFGRAYDIPYGGGKGLNFSEHIGSYHDTQAKNGQRIIDIEVTNTEDTYFYSIKVYDNGSSTIDVQSRNLEHISYSGMMDFTR